MRKTTAKSIGLLFFATASVYSGRSTAADQTADAAKSGNTAPAPARSTGSAQADATLRAAQQKMGGSDTSAAAGPGNYFAKAAPKTASSVSDVTPVEGATAPTPVTLPVDPFAQATVINSANGGSSVTDNDVAYDNAAGTVEIHVNDANLVEVLRMLSLQSQKNIIASKDVKGTVTANLYSVTVREALDAILAANGYAYEERGNFVYVYTKEELATQEQANRKRETRIFRVFYTPVATAVNMIKPVLSKDGELAFSDPAKSGLESGSADAGGNSHSTEDVMVVTDFADRLDEVARVLKEVDTRPQQILIEATILRATLNEDNAMGIDFQVLGGVDFAGFSAGGGTGINSAVRSLGADSAAVNNGVAGAGTGFTNNVPKGGLSLGMIKNNIAVFLEALETVTDTTVLANPKILALNKQKGEVIVGREDGYITSTTTDTSTVQTVEFLQTGTRLIFRPYIGDDGFIRMEIHPEDSSGGLTGANLPFKVTTEVTSNVLVRDGHTIVIGGLFREDSNSTRGQVPGLGNIPFAGALFRSQRDRTTREEIIILLTPHIVKDESIYAQASEKEFQRLDHLRVGVRRGMMGSGRERLAEGFYDGAQAELAKANPDRGKVMWNLNAATNLNPKFIEAIELKQQMTGHDIQSVDNSISRDFVRNLALSDMKRVDTAEVAAAKFEVPAATQPTTMPTTVPAMTAQASAPTPEPIAPSKEPADLPLTTRIAVPTRYAYRWLGFDQWHVTLPQPQTATVIDTDPR
jgi:type IV pilus assembly protein PilQ